MYIEVGGINAGFGGKGSRVGGINKEFGGIPDQFGGINRQLGGIPLMKEQHGNRLRSDRRILIKKR
ncbi:hypothetical protein [Neobacillus drentensis]|uniref:hypothetical protein n=1 Tax=Neobacillus drentensis TaxID=220684 RepID=UPI000825532F|nr:hypothetical protein [Neobacillus drentensis]